ncbi:MAG: hypothetical protein EA398_16265 [Deltaproteobacteria bacterium]|nr:MAG: hypothetical protein EA398_16265 [Deltaproteobacteria bacterium]
MNRKPLVTVEGVNGLIAATVYGDWAYHESTGGDGWSVTHVPSGLGVHGFESPAMADACCRQLLEEVYGEPMTERWLAAVRGVVNYYREGDHD